MKKTIYLKDYRAPEYQIDSVDLIFDLALENTTVRSRLAIRAKPGTLPNTPLLLNGDDLELVNIRYDGEILPPIAYELNEEGLLIKHPASAFTLDITTKINPAANSRLSGLFVTGGVFCTQCEAHGFRRITYFIDRPDNLSRFTTTIVADKEQYPVMLSNGNKIDGGETNDGRHWIKWEDPFRKPSCLFALVAGKFDRLEDKFITCSGREVTLHLYVEPGQLDKTTYAMASLKKAMRWDEEMYGREYDLDIFMTVAVRDFNFGAMENKGLNIFNSKYILANPETATDVDFENILGVVGHEYFHNWSGNRVACRDWFQLSLKEGLTVFRDQTFTAEQTSAAIKRIDDVNILRTHQFAEDSGPMAHPVQPKSFIEVDNFYTLTVYNKGAELIRMQRTLLGKEKFRAGMDLYFQRHDGQAVTIEDFLQAMQDASGIDLRQFKHWYDQIGTPKLTVNDNYDAKRQTYTLTIAQTLSATNKMQQPLHIPVAVGLLDEKGKEILPTQVLEVKQMEQQFVFNQITKKPVPSLLRSFSAPVHIDYAYRKAQLTLLLAHDTDSFSRWDAGQQLALLQVNQLLAAIKNEEALCVDETYLDAVGRIITGDFSDKALQALLLTLPSEKYLIESMQIADPAAIHRAREFLRYNIVEYWQKQLVQLYQQNVVPGEYCHRAEDNAHRRVKNVCLSYLSLIDQGELAWQQYQTANNMMDRMAALQVLANLNGAYRQQALTDFYQRYEQDALVTDMWLMVQALSSLPNTLQRVRTLMQDKVFNIKNPNSVRALIGTFANANLAQFHASDGSGYAFLSEQVIAIDQFNPQLAARLVTPLLPWYQFTPERRRLMRDQLEHIMAAATLSKNTDEVITKALAKK